MIGAPVDGAARRRHDEVLADIARFAGSSLDLDDVLERIVQRAPHLTGADRASIWLLDRAGKILLPSALWGMDPAFTAGWKTRPLAVSQEPLSREAIVTGAPVVVPDAAGDPRTDKLSVAFFGDLSILVAPLSRRGKVLGTLFLNHVRQRYDFTPRDVDTTIAVANQAAIAIDNAQLYGDTRRLAEQLRRSFRTAGEALAAGVDLQQTLQSVLQLAVETVGAGGGSLRLLDETGRGTYLVAVAGSEPPRRDQPGPQAEGAAPDAEDDVFASVFPLRAGGVPLGALRLWRAALPFDEEERELLASFADHGRAAVEHARLYARLQEERARAQVAERTQNDFVSMVSHELRTPLALIKGYVATLQRRSLGLSPEMQARFLEGIDTACDRLRRLIDNLLTATAVEANAFVYRPKPLDVGAVLRSAVAEVAMLARGRTVALQLGDERLHVLGDEDQLVQVVENLINNALKHAPGETPVYVSAAQRDSRVRITVRDGGPGIPDEALELIFQKFYRVHMTRGLHDAGRESPPSADQIAPHAGAPADPPASTPEDRRQGGIGLGLYICRRIVEAHGGRIWAENGREGGAAFHIEVPAVIGPPASLAQVDKE